MAQIIQHFSKQNSEAKFIINELTDLAKSYCSDHYVSTGLYAKETSMDRKTYNEKNEQMKTAILGFCKAKSGIDFLDLTSKRGIATAFSNSNFATIYNSIIAETVSNVVLSANPVALMNFTEMRNVGVGDSETFIIEPKGLPIAQRGSYLSNVTFMNGMTAQGITVKPMPYSLGVQMDFIRILDKTFDVGKEVAKVSMGMLYAQYKLVVSLIFGTATLTGTPFYSATYSSAVVTRMIEFLQAVNGGTSVKAYGTLTAFNKAGTIATTNYGFATQDDMIRDGFLGKAFGIDNIMLPNATDLSSPMTVDSTLLIPNDLIVLLSDIGDKPVKLVREDYVKVIESNAQDNALATVNYSYHMAFDGAIATQAQYALIKVAA